MQKVTLARIIIQLPTEENTNLFSKKNSDYSANLTLIKVKESGLMPLEL